MQPVDVHDHDEMIIPIQNLDKERSPLETNRSTTNLDTIEGDQHTKQDHMASPKNQLRQLMRK